MKTNDTPSFRQDRFKCMLTIVVFLILLGCKPTQFIEFDAFTVERGIYKAKSEWEFLPQSNGSYMVAKINNNSDSGGAIVPCDCALTTGGSCLQASIEDANGNIIEIWCVSEGCGFCVGGVTDDANGGQIKSVKIRLEKSYGKAKR